MGEQVKHQVDAKKLQGNIQIQTRTFLIGSRHIIDKVLPNPI